MSESLPAVTTVIPTYRRPNLLGRAIGSVLSQSFRSVRVCVYDNASGDETQAVVEGIMRRDDRVTYVRNSTNIGAFANIKKGVADVITPYYTLLSDDDFLLPGFLAGAVAAFETDPTVQFVCGKVVIVDEVRNRLQFLNRDWSPGRFSPSSSVIQKMYSSHFASTGVVFKTSVRQNLGALDPIGNDVLYMTLAAGTWAFTVLDFYVAVFTLRSDSFSYAVGLSGLPIDELNTALAENIDQIARLPTSAALRAHLSMLATHSYQRTVDTKKLRVFLDRGNVSETAGEAWPPTRPAPSAHGWGVRLFEAAPPWARGMLSGIMALAMRLRQSISSDASRWIPMTITLRDILSKQPDADAFVAALQATPYAVIAHPADRGHRQ